MRRSLLVVSALVAMTAAGCQATDLAKRELKLETKICDQLQAVGTALEQVAALKPTSTVGEAQAADKALGTALEKLGQAEQALEKVRLEAFQNQLKSFKAEVAKVAADKKLTLEQAAADLKLKAAPVIAARKQLSAAVKCQEPAAADAPAAAPAEPAKP